MIGTAPYQRGNIRKRWGYRTRKWIDTPYGSLENVRIPRVRGRHHEIRLFADRFVKRSELLKESMLEMFVAGVSTRSISGLMKRFTGTGISAGAICRLRRFVKEELSQMRRSRIDSSIRILVVDGVWGRYRKGGKQGVCLVALGVDKTGKTHLLDWLGCDAESGAHWRRLFRRLRERGLKQVELLVSDDHKAAVEAYHQVWSKQGAHQLCLWHFQQQLQKRLSSISWGKRRRFVHHYWEVFNAFSLEECEHRARQFLAEWKAHSEMVDYFQAHWPQLTNYYRYPEEWRHRIRTVNLAEQFFAQLQTFIRRFPGWIDEEHIELLLAFFVKTRRLFQFKKMEIPKTLLNFNTFY
ncbi:hypothetical protein D6779_10180 [Candidatus Parcubacteria bacterium]|nr:MAG: hypothetical protein D6779_10180 [Candidatus Parcubacteria bacterium]